MDEFEYKKVAGGWSRRKKNTTDPFQPSNPPAGQSGGDDSVDSSAARLGYTPKPKESPAAVASPTASPSPSTDMDKSMVEKLKSKMTPEKKPERSDYPAGLAGSGDYSRALTAWRAKTGQS